MTGNDNMALLSYNEVASLFKKGDQSKNLATCYNNIGCIHLKKKDFKTQYKYFSRAIQIAEDQLQKEDVSSASVETRFKLACRLYN